MTTLVIRAAIAGVAFVAGYLFHDWLLFSAESSLPRSSKPENERQRQQDEALRKFWEARKGSAAPADAPSDDVLDALAQWDADLNALEAKEREQPS